MNCVKYQDEFSAGKSAINDLKIGQQHQRVGCGSSWMNRAKSGHIVTICAKKDGVLHAVIVVLQDKLESCSIWADEGGCTWPYNWTYRPLTSLFIYTPELKHHVETFCTLNSLKYNNLFHPRFCSIKLKPIVDELICIFKE